MKINNRFNIYDLQGKRILYADVTNTEQFSIYDTEGRDVAYGVFHSHTSFSMYHKTGERTYGIMDGMTSFNIYNLNRTQISYGMCQQKRRITRNEKSRSLGEVIVYLCKNH